MKPLRAHIILLFLAALLSGMAGCRKSAEERINWNVNLDRGEKTPYGSALVYATLPDYFPGARRESLSKYFKYTALDDAPNVYSDSVHLAVLLGLDFRLTEAEWLRLLQFVRNGNEVFIITAGLDPKVCRDLHLRVRHNGSEQYPLLTPQAGEESERSLRLEGDSLRRYGFNGRYINGWFEPGVIPSLAEALPSEEVTTVEEPRHRADDDEQAPDPAAHASRTFIDTKPEILGYSRSGPDFIRYRIGAGRLTLHAAPLAFSNYFLLQPENRPYLNGIWQQFPANVSRLYWNEFMIRKTERSSFKGLLKYPPIRYALLVAGLTLLLYVLFSMKRRQRIIPVLPPLENASVSFVETVGRLYFNKGDHLNLAEKMVQHFLEWVRGSYYLDTSRMDGAFVQQLSMKSGKPQAEVQELIDIIARLRNNAWPGSPEFLNELYTRIQSFYKTDR